MMSWISTAAVFALVTAILTALVLQYGPKYFRLNKPENFGGFVKPGFENVQKAFKKNFENNWDYEGAAFSVCYKGQIVVDLWGGYANSEEDKLWNEDTMAIAFSATKAVTSLCLAILVDRGYLKYDDLVTKYWPEFGKNNKSSTTIRMLVSHQAGLAYLDEPITFDLIRDWQKMGEAIENQTPNWPVGHVYGYHAVTHGFLVDQIMRRVDPQKRSLGQFFNEELAAPNGLDFYIGLPKGLENRVANVITPSKWRTLYELTDRKIAFMFLKFLIWTPEMLKKIFAKTAWMVEPTSERKLYFNDPEFYSLEIGAANGIGTARALAKLFCLFGSGKLVGQETLKILSKPIFVNTKDRVLEIVFSTGHGFIYDKNPQGNFAMGHQGYGGQVVKYDPDYDVSFGYIRNGMTMGMGDSIWTYNALENAVYDVIMKKT